MFFAELATVSSFNKMFFFAALYKSQKLVKRFIITNVYVYELWRELITENSKGTELVITYTRFMPCFLFFHL